MDMQLETLEVGSLEVVGNPCDLRRDLHTFMEYVINRQIKRSVRENLIPKAEARRIVKFLSMPGAVKEVEQFGFSHWLDELDSIALEMGWISYDTQGEYIGYTSQERSFVDNYIEADKKKYRSFLNLPLIKQEEVLLKKLINNYSACNNEFFIRGALGRLNPFMSWGCNDNVLPFINFSKIRYFLMNQLSLCQSNVWYSVNSLIRYLKSHHPFFLIPRHPEQSYYGKAAPDRYNNFKERKGKEHTYQPISSSQSDCFKRVEGRYVERFLESLPLTFGFLELAYGKPQTAIQPNIDELKGFKLNDLFLTIMNKSLPEPDITIEPNFEIQVESAVYPALTLQKLKPLTDCKRIGTISTLKLNRNKIAAAIAKDEKLDVQKLLRQLSGAELPENVAIELKEWEGQADAFVLYSGFGLLESDKVLPEHAGYLSEKIDKGIDLVKNPDQLFQEIENAQAVPLLMSHGKKHLHPLPEIARTRLPKKSDKKRLAHKKEKLILKRSVEICLSFPDKQTFEMFRKALTDSQCIFQPEPEVLGIRYMRDDQKKIEAALKSLNNKFKITIQDIEK